MTAGALHAPASKWGDADSSHFLSGGSLVLLRAPALFRTPRHRGRAPVYADVFSMIDSHDLLKMRGRVV